uniref:hypothetical protein n=1 Tax=Jeotgalibaca porci TaxID=1868793 RepID=UPI0035A03AB6
MKIYALYKGEELMSIGTIKEIAKSFGVKPRTVMFYQSPAYTKRTSESKGRRLVLLEEDDD